MEFLLLMYIVVNFLAVFQIANKINYIKYRIKKGIGLIELVLIIIFLPAIALATVIFFVFRICLGFEKGEEK